MRLSAWTAGCWCGCLGGRAVGLDGQAFSLDSEAGREALSLDGWLVLWLSGRFSGGWPVNLVGRLVRGQAARSAYLLEGLSIACIVGWW